MTLFRAVVRPGFLISAWPWRGIAYSGTTAVVTVLVWLALALPVAPLILAVQSLRSGRLAAAAGLGLLGIGLTALAAPRLAVALSGAERFRLRLADDAETIPPHRGRLYTDPATWRAVVYLLLLAVVAPVWLGVIGVLGLLVGATPIAVYHRVAVLDSPGDTAGRLALGLVLLLVLLYLAAVFGGAHATLARLLLCGEPDPAGLVEVTRSRARLADAFEAERLRIERDLHDVAQQRLVSLTMQLGLARVDLPPDSPAAGAVAAAHDSAKALMTELRDLIRGISPRTLRELGLRAAIEEVAAASPLRVRVDAAAGRFPSMAETVAFAAVSEALANAVKHASATEATVTARPGKDHLTVEVRDDGRGGADPARGSGLTGLADRAAAAGGRLLISSPDGGPTILRVELPCAS